MDTVEADTPLLSLWGSSGSIALFYNFMNTVYDRSHFYYCVSLRAVVPFKIPIFFFCFLEQLEVSKILQVNFKFVC